MSEISIKALALMGARAMRMQHYTSILAIEKEFPELKGEPIDGVPALLGKKKASSAAPAKKRSTMSPAMRKQVSARMKKYWASKRKAAKAEKKEAPK